MCDYSLVAVSNRLAASGEELVVRRFSTGAVGLASPVDVREQRMSLQKLGFLEKFRRFFEVPFVPEKVDEGVPAICLPPGARLLVRDFPAKLQRQCGCEEVEEVSFTQTSLNPASFRDAIRFDNGKQLLLQRLKRGQRVRVLALSSRPRTSANPDCDSAIEICQRF